MFLNYKRGFVIQEKPTNENTNETRCLPSTGKPEDLIRHKLKEVYERKQLLNGQKKGPFPLNKSPQLGGRGHAPPPMRPQAPGMAPPPGPSHTPPWPPRPRGPVAIAPFPSATLPARGSPPRWQPKDLTQGPRDQVTGPHAREKKPKEKAPPKGALVAMAPEPSDGPEMTLPLIRTKTGRIILPSSLKPREFFVQPYSFIVT